MDRPTRNAGSSEPQGQRLELRYCERCGTLRFLPAGASNTACPACWRVLWWMYGEVPDATRRF